MEEAHLMRSRICGSKVIKMEDCKRVKITSQYKVSYSHKKSSAIIAI